MAPPAEPPADFATLFAAERETLLELLAGLAPADWRRPTPCPAWTVHGLVLHLVGDDLGVLSRQRDQHFGTVPPAEAQSGAAFIEWLDELQLEWVAAARRVSPRLAVTLLSWTGPQLVELLRSQDPTQRTAHVSWAGPQPVPVWLDQGRELSEYWIHRQQLLEAVGRPSDLDPEVTGPVLSALRWAYPFRLSTVTARPGDTVSIAVDGPVTAAWHLVLGPTGWEHRPEPGARPVAALGMTTDQAWRLLTNNLPEADRARLSASGDPDVLDVLLATRAIIGAAK